MSKKGLYRQNIAFVERYNWTFEGEPVFWDTQLVWVKGNVQPYKAGLVQNINDAGKLFTDWKQAYTKNKPVFDYTGKPPTASYNGMYAYYNGLWYGVTGQQDWSKQARGVKHFKYLLVNDSLAPIDIPQPVPFAETVQNFEQVVLELEQLNDTINEVL